MEVYHSVYYCLLLAFTYYLGFSTAHQSSDNPYQPVFNPMGIGGEEESSACVNSNAPPYCTSYDDCQTKQVYKWGNRRYKRNICDHAMCMKTSFAMEDNDCTMTTKACSCIINRERTCYANEEYFRINQRMGRCSRADPMGQGTAAVRPECYNLCKNIVAKLRRKGKYYVTRDAVLRSYLCTGEKDKIEMTPRCFCVIDNVSSDRK